MTETLGPHSFFGLVVYFGIVMFCSLTQTFLVHYIVKKAPDICIRPADIVRNLEWKSQRFTYLAVPALYLLVVVAVTFDLGVNVITMACLIWAATLTAIRKRYFNAPPSSGGPVLARIFKPRKLLRQTEDDKA